MEPHRFDHFILHHLSEGVFEGEDEPEGLFRAWIYTESAFNPYAIRYEKDFRWLPDDLKEGTTEWMARKTSWGLLQIMGQVARERGFDARYLAELCDPALNFKYAVKHLEWGRRRGEGTWDQALAAYNGGLGGNARAPFRNQHYVDLVRSRVERFS